MNKGLHSMFERLQKPFLTVETGEAYQPIRLSYKVNQSEQLATILNSLKCLAPQAPNTWDWYWRAECEDLRFESVDSYKKHPENHLRLGTFILRGEKLYLSLASFKRACLAVPLFNRLIPITVAKIQVADFINKVFGMSEELPPAFTELFSDPELKLIISKRIEDYEKMQVECENARSADEALRIFAEYTEKESKKRLPYAESYVFDDHAQDADVAFLGFYIFLRSRELVAIRRWFGDASYTLADAADETIEQVFGNMDIDLIE